MNVVSFANIAKAYHLRHHRHSSLSLQFNQLLKNFGQDSNWDNQDFFYALKNVSFDIVQGESIAVMGSNGAGKTTILKLISNITKPTSGHLQVHGRIAPLIELGAGFHPELTGRENVFLNAVILGMTKRDIVKRFDEIVSFAELEKFIDSPIKQYSSGMYIRLGFSVAIHSNFDILLADEILAVGDLHFQKKCFDKFQEIRKEKKTLILISHSPELVQKHCSRGLLLKDGGLIADSSIQEICRQYSLTN